MKISEKLWLGKLATPLPDRHRPIYNWFAMKEAFSRDLVFLLAETWRLGEGDLVLDPFCGTGTTPLACKELGLNCVGYDVHPALLFASRVKLRDYDADKLRESVKILLKSEFERREVDAPGFVARVFSRSVLEDIVSARQRIQDIDDEATREFMLLGLTVAAMRCSWAHKDGAAIKVVKRPVPPLRKELDNQLRRMCNDIERFKAKRISVRVEHGDVRNLDLDDGSVDAVITSPPYFGKQEYVHAHRIEQWVIGIEGPSEDDLIGSSSDGDGKDFLEVAEFVEGKPLESKAYFKDMLVAIREIYRVCKDGANVCMVVSDGCFQDGSVDVCVPLSELAEKVGFKAKRVIVVNKRYCTTPTRKKVGIAREGLLFWAKRN